MTKRNIKIRVPALARVEGEGALVVDVHQGEITNLQLRIYEPPRYFEKFLEGRDYVDVPEIVARICGICPVAYQMSAVQALEAIFEVQVSDWVNDMRRVMYCGEWIQSHSLHIHMLAAPDFLGFNSITEIAGQYPAEVQRGLQLQGIGNKLIALFGGRSVHPVGVRVGGFHQAPAVADVDTLLSELEVAISQAEALLHWTASLELPEITQETIYVALQQPGEYPLNQGRIVSSNGVDLAPGEFESRFSECHVAHSTALHATLDGKPYLVGPLARINLNLAQLPTSVQQILQQLPVQFPSNNMFHSIVARAAEILCAVVEAKRLLENYQLPAQAYVEVTPRAGHGYGCSEAPRGILWHHYETDDNGKIVSARIVPPTSQNQARIEEDLRFSLTQFGLEQDEQALRLHGEKVIRNYDPCISCATHFLSLQINRDSGATATEWYKQFAPGASIKVIGVGSPQFGDSLGLDVVALLQQQARIAQHPRISLHSLDRPGMQLLEELRQTEAVIIIDALQADEVSEQVLLLPIGQLAASSTTTSSHHLGVAEALQLAATLGIPTDNMVVVGMAVATGMQHTHQQTQVVADAVTELLTPVLVND